MPGLLWSLIDSIVTSSRQIDGLSSRVEVSGLKEAAMLEQRATVAEQASRIARLAAGLRKLDRCVCHYGTLLRLVFKLAHLFALDVGVILANSTSRQHRLTISDCSFVSGSDSSGSLVKKRSCNFEGVGLFGSFHLPQ